MLRDQQESGVMGGLGRGYCGVAGWLAYPVALLEVSGGILLLAGLASRWVALALLPVLLGALTVHSGNGWLYTNANGGWEYAAFLTLACLVQALLGDGRYTLREIIATDRRPLHA